MSLAETAGWVATGIAGAGVVLTYVGLRGKRVDDHPLCPKCRFDLFGLPDDHSRCPECGRWLSKPVRRDAIIGNRSKRPVMIVAGLVMILVVLLPAAVIGVGAWRGNAYAVQPTFLLAWLAENGDAITRRSAFTELCRRRDSSTLSSDQIASIRSKITATYADPVYDEATHRFIFRVSDQAGREWVEWEHRTGQLPAEVWERHLHAMTAARVSVRPRVRRGDPLPINITLATLSGELYLSRCEDIRVKIDSVDVTLRAKWNPDRKPYRDGDRQFLVYAESGGWMPKSPGPHKLSVTVKFAFFDRGQFFTTFGPPMIDSVVEKTFEESFEVLSDDQPSLTRVKLADDVLRQRLRISELHYDGRIRFAIQSPTAQPFAGRATAHADGRTWDLGEVYFSPALSEPTLGTELVVEDFDVRSCDIVITPDPAIAVRTVDVFELPGAGLRFRSVPLDRPFDFFMIEPEIERVD